VISGVVVQDKTNNPSLMTLQGIGKSYLQPNGQTITIIENINLDLRTEQITALLGPSGSGKSTLMRMIAGLIPPTSGNVLYYDRPLTGLNPGVAIVFQNFALYPWLTVLENVELGLKAKGEPKDSRERKALKMIDVIGLDGFENAYPKELSGGMRQRVGFARALAVEPELLCMDEPFSALDVLTAENLRYELLDLWLERRIPTKSILIVTHGIEEAVTLADRIIVLGRNPGRIRADLSVTLPHYRDRKSPEFQAIVDQVYKIITQPDLDVDAMDTAARTSQSKTEHPQRYQFLPSVRIGSIAGLIEILEDRQGYDLYRLAQELMLEVDDILPILDAAKLLDLIVLSEGDISITELGQKFVQGNIDERKHMIKLQILSHIRLAQQINQLLQSKRNHRIPEEMVLDILEKYFTTGEARAQLETVIHWGRYAELYSYDEPSGEIFFEQEVNQLEEAVPS
jgi:NitT/TauT family transport system ATP-binding protein